MVRRRRESGPPAREGAVAGATLSLLERLALLILLAIVPLRTVLAETHTFELARMFRNLGASGGAQPGTTFLITGLIAAVAALVACVRLVGGGGRYCRTGAELGAAILLLAGVISIARAGQKHLACIGVIDFLGMVLYLLTLRQLLRRPRQIRLALAVVLTTGVVVIVKCAYQHWVELPETLAYYEAHKRELVQEDGADPVGAPSSGFQYDYEQRLRAASPTGYYGHPNLLGSHLILFIMTAVAAAVGRRRAGRAWWTAAAPLAVAVGGAAALVSTKSKGAMVACAIALVCWLVGQGWGGRLARRPRAALVGCALLLAVGVGALAGVLRANPEALGRSILFRTMYWRGAWKMVADLGPLGVGANNFGRHFTKYKSADCPEEVESPHSWPVRFAAEWGALGLAGILALFGGVAIELTRRARRPGAVPVNADDCRGASVILWCGGIGLLLFGWWTPLLAEAGAGFLAMTLLVAASPWFLGFIAVSAESTDVAVVPDDALGPIVPALCAGLIGFLVHTGIDLAMFAGGPATTFFALVAVTLAARPLCSRAEGAVESNAEGPRRHPPQRSWSGRTGVWITVVVAGLGLFLYGAFFVRPAVRLTRFLDVARVAKAPPRWQDYAVSTGGVAYRRASKAYRLDGTAESEWIEQLIPRVGTVEQADAAIEIAEDYRRRDPDSGLGLNHLGTLYYQRYRLGRDPADLRRAVGFFQAYVDVYPTSPNRRVYLANFLEEYAEITGDGAQLARAARELRAALDLDARRVYVSKPNRFTAEEIGQIRARIAGLAGR